MTNATNSPKTLMEAIQYFSDKQNCLNFVVGLRWAGGVTCPCGCKNVTAIATRQLWQCKVCRKQFSVKVGTIFEDSPLPLSKWLAGMWLLSNCKNGISSCELARSLGVTQKTAWFMLHRIREAMRNGSVMKFSGTVESDETFIGGLPKNRHASERAVSKQGQKSHKTMVHVMLERGGSVRAAVVDNQKAKTLLPRSQDNVAPGATIYTDTLRSYLGLAKNYVHGTVDHENNEYVIVSENENEKIHTNTIEGYWSLLKRALRGTYIHVEPFHLDRYLDEQAFRYDARKTVDGTRFVQAVASIVGKRLTYAQLTGRVATA